MNLIENIDAIRRKQDISIKQICEHAKISTTAYEKYLSGVMEPSMSVATRLMDAVEKQIVLCDKNMKNIDKNIEWGMLNLFFNANKGILEMEFRRISEIFYVADALIYATLKLALLASWFNKYHDKQPAGKLYREVVVSDYDHKSLISKGQELGLLTIDAKPTKLAYTFYDKSISHMKNYLQQAGVSRKIL